VETRPIRPIRAPQPIPVKTGIGLRAKHHAQILRERPDAAWFEAHSENYFAAGGVLPGILERIAEDYPLSLHGVGLSIGTTDPLDLEHLAKLKRLIERCQPALISEHLCWGAIGGRFTNDLLPLPHTEEALRHMIGRVRDVQDFLGVQILIENVSSYVEYSASTMTEWDFLAALAKASGCRVLLDINNIYVSAMNHAFDARAFIDAMPRHAVREMHLAGHSVDRHRDREIRIDTHSTQVCDDVWSLYRYAVRRLPGIPTLIEWDTDIPALDVLMAEAAKADAIQESQHVESA